MVEWMRNDLGVTSLKFQRLKDMIAAIGLSREKLCTYCWSAQSKCFNGKDTFFEDVSRSIQSSEWERIKPTDIKTSKPNKPHYV